MKSDQKFEVGDRIKFVLGSGSIEEGVERDSSKSLGAAALI
jgi:hypothetical protein